MNVDLMRKVDFYAGVPLCFFFTILRKIIPQPKQQKGRAYKNVLFIELSEMGSAILVDPAMKKLRDDHQGNIFFVIFKKNKPSLDLLKTVKEENIFCLRESSFVALIIDTLRFFIWTRKNMIDTTIDLELFSRFTALLSFFSGGQNRVGFYSFHNEGLYRGEFLSHKVAYNPHIHIAKNFIALINSLVSKKEEIPFSKTFISKEDIQLEKREVSEEEKGSLFQKLSSKLPKIKTIEDCKIVLINPNASELLIQRRWMPDYYATLAKTIIDNYPETIILITGSKSEQNEAEQLVRKVDRDRCLTIAGLIDFLELPVLYSLSHLMVTNDSGPGHFSSITGLPVFVIFGPETPQLYGSLGNSRPIYAGLACSPCVSAWNHRKTACSDNVCLQVIKPEEVYKEITPALNSKTWIDVSEL